MRRIIVAVVSFAGLVAGQTAQSFYAVTHVDVIGSGGNLDVATRLVREFAVAPRR